MGLDDGVGAMSPTTLLVIVCFVCVYVSAGVAGFSMHCGYQVAPVEIAIVCLVGIPFSALGIGLCFLLPESSKT